MFQCPFCDANIPRLINGKGKCPKCKAEVQVDPVDSAVDQLSNQIEAFWPWVKAVVCLLVLAVVFLIAQLAAICFAIFNE